MFDSPIVSNVGRYCSASEAHEVVCMLAGSADLEVRYRGLGERDIEELQAAMDSAVNIWVSLDPERRTESDAMQILSLKIMGTFSDFLADAALLESVPRKEREDGH